MHEVECRDIRHSYDGVHDAVAGVDLRLPAGQIVALVGPNGAGKSTMLRILATLQRPQQGSVQWDGIDAWSHRHDIRPKIGFLGDGDGLYPSMKVGEYLGFFAHCYGYDDRAARARVKDLLTVFDLSAKSTNRIGDLSKGMRQRVAVARTMVHEPELLLLDEPADGLDPRSRRDLRSLLREVASRGIAMVVSSHVLRELDDFCDGLAIMQNGKIEIAGTVTEVLQRYDTGHRLHEVQAIAGLQRAVDYLRGQRLLVEAVLPLEQDGATSEAPTERGRVLVRIPGSEDATAQLLQGLLECGVEIIAFAQVSSRLEDVYQALG